MQNSNFLKTPEIFTKTQFSDKYTCFHCHKSVQKRACSNDKQWGNVLFYHCQDNHLRYRGKIGMIFGLHHKRLAQTTIISSSTRNLKGNVSK